MDATHLNKLLQCPSLAPSMRLGQETRQDTARRVEGQSAAREDQVGEGFDVSEWVKVPSISKWVSAY